MMKRVAIITALVLATLAVVGVILSYPEAVIMFLGTLAVAAAARPMVDWLIGRGLKRGLAVLLTFLTIFLLLAILLVIVVPLLIKDLTVLSDDFVVTYDYIFLNWPNGTALQQAIARQLPEPATLYASITGEQGAALARGLLGWTASTATVIGQILAVLVLSIYWTIDRIYFERLWLSLLPVASRARWRAIGRDIEVDLGAYIRSELAQSVLAGLLLLLGFSLMGLPYPTITAIFVAFAWLIPWLGAALAVIGVVIHAAMSGSLLLAILAPAFTAAVLLVMQMVVEPRIFSRRQYNSWLIILFLMALGDALGLVGVIIAPPLATITVLVFRRILAASSTSSAAIEPDTTTEGLESARRIASLDARIQELRTLMDTLEEKPSPKTANMLERLDELVRKANGMLDDHYPPSPVA